MFLLDKTDNRLMSIMYSFIYLLYSTYISIFINIASPLSSESSIGGMKPKPECPILGWL
jgi:hypothetical protein